MSVAVAGGWACPLTVYATDTLLFALFAKSAVTIAYVPLEFAATVKLLLTPAVRFVQQAPAGDELNFTAPTSVWTAPPRVKLVSPMVIGRFVVFVIVARYTAPLVNGADELPGSLQFCPVNDTVPGLAAIARVGVTTATAGTAQAAPLATVRRVKP